MKRFLAIFLLIAISYQFVAKMGIIAWYNANRDYVAANLCENRSKPQMHCNGKCYLKKQLKKVDDNTDNKQAPQNKKDKTEVLTFIIVPYHTLPDVAITTDKLIHTIVYNNHYSFTSATDFFHPPGLC